MRRRYAYNSMRECPKCKKFVYCDRLAGSCGQYTMETHLDSVCEANRNPCTLCGIMLNNDEVVIHLAEYCSKNATDKK
jgi:hypothetical protein